MFSNFVFSFLFLCCFFSINNCSSLKRLLAENENNNCPQNDESAIKAGLYNFRSSYSTYCDSGLTSEDWNTYSTNTNDMLSIYKKNIYLILYKKCVINSITENFDEIYYVTVINISTGEGKGGVRGVIGDRTKEIIDSVCNGLFNEETVTIDNNCNSGRLDYSGETIDTGLAITGYGKFVKENNVWKMEAFAETEHQIIE